jgi:hypothetical protein
LPDEANLVAIRGEAKAEPRITSILVMGLDVRWSIDPSLALAVMRSVGIPHRLVPFGHEPVPMPRTDLSEE